ncbi:MAG: RNA 2',3'-cyclic phosphodiesterase [Deltaproteobacteria bacterium]|jgi:RNA 2',3'-cyclic 3'-phosphodiesterase|nr:RNA 2',3'-cyclic phosphodiesterase [Deltaproteobacteria bacterium]
MKIRSFLAFDIAEDMRSELTKIVTLLTPKIRDVQWIKPELMHCTVRFFGDVEEELLLGNVSNVIEREVKHQSPVKLIGRGIGVFPNWRYPRVLWAGLHGETESMISLHAKLEEAFTEFGFKQDPRELRLHLTLGRAKKKFKDGRDLMGLVEKMSEKGFGEMMIDSLTLYKSELTKEGPIYTVLKKFPLGGKKK